MGTTSIEVRNIVLGSTTNQIVGEVPYGTINGSNQIFSLTNTPTKLSLYINGIRMKKDEDYTINTNIIQILIPPIPGDILLADYTY